MEKHNKANYGQEMAGLIIADINVRTFEKEFFSGGMTDIRIERSGRLFFMPVGIISGKKSAVRL
ncbi:MAG: hypothetical protein NTU44_01970 [Bacteroidetes bacterium]|nr:hypothetical protein [Bacteroidota bacterium]